MDYQLIELRQAPVSINDPISTGSTDGAKSLSGILGSILGESPKAQKARLDEVSRSANDLTGLIKKKKPASTVEVQIPLRHEPAESNKKRKAKAEEVEEVGESKKARVEDVGES